MIRIANAKLKGSRIVTLLAALFVASALSGCVVEHGPGYVGIHHYDHDDD